MPSTCLTTIAAQTLQKATEETFSGVIPGLTPGSPISDRSMTLTDLLESENSRWLTVISKEEQDGTEVLLEPHRLKWGLLNMLCSTTLVK